MKLIGMDQSLSYNVLDWGFGIFINSHADHDIAKRVLILQTTSLCFLHCYCTDAFD